MSSLFGCVRAGDFSACKAIVEEQGSAVLHTRDPQGLTPLHHACIQGASDLAAYLVDAGSDVNARGLRGETPLQYAVMRGALPIAMLLLRAGADTCARDASGYTILHHAVLSRQTAIAYELLEVNPELSKIQDDTGRTCLHWASYGGLQEVVERLVSAGSDVNLQDRDGFTPIHLAALFGHKMAAKVLVDKGAQCTIKEWKDGKTPSECASSKGHHDLALFLSWAANRNFTPSQKVDFKENVAMGLGFAAPILGPPIASLIPQLWAIPVLVIGAIVVRIFKKKHDRKHAHSGRLAYGIFVGTNVSLPFTFLFGLTTWRFPICSLLFTLCAGVTWVLCAQLTASDAGVVVASAQERDEVDSAISKGTFPANYCITCAVKRLPRMKHCSVCGKCIKKFDHHCVFLLGDVGAKNHFRFWVLILCVLTCVLTFVRVAFVHLLENFGNHQLWMNTNWMGFCIFWSLVNSYWIFGLFSLQTRLVANNLTYNEYVNAGRYEYLKDSRGLFFNPYDKGGITNFLEFFGFTEKSRDSPIPVLEV